jgi:hypothetical protein
MSLQLAPLNTPPPLAEDETTLRCVQCGAAYELDEARVQRALNVAIRVAQGIIDHKPQNTVVLKPDDIRAAAKLCWVCNHLRIGVGTEHDPVIKALDAMLTELPQ